ncbi:MAG: lamin tail domain-containing protein [Verrucomicrobiales bacterium]|nr:lamin tail domain-containing protein [Verrucomicrobiales bacterium]
MRCACWVLLFVSLLPSALGQPALRVSEFMAANSETLPDEDGDFSDWIEIENPGPGPIDLAGWSLSDSADALSRWVFPATNVDAGARLLVFASNKDRRIAGAPLHTDFRLSAGGEYLGLFSPAGEAVSEFSPAFPPQAPDVSFGSGRQSQTIPLLTGDTPARYLVPEGDTVNPGWFQGGEPGAGWQSGFAAIGYETSPAEYAGWIRTDVRAAMQQRNPSCLVLVPFIVDEPLALAELELAIRFDDGFVAWLNGVEIAHRNAPADLAWNSAATANHPDAEALIPETFDLSAHRERLVPGANWLALHGLNVSPGSSDFLLVPELSATRIAATDTTWRYFTEPTPGAPNGGGSGNVGPLIRSLSHLPAPPGRPAAADDLVVLARVSESFDPVAGATLRYRIGFAPEQALPMADDGAHGDGAAGDGLFGARIPSAAAGPGELVRYRIEAFDTAGVASRWPPFVAATNSPEYQGTVVADPAVESPLPVWEWFAANPSLGRTRSGTRGAVFFNDRLYDNVFIRARGGATSGGSQKFDFNTGDHLFVNEAVGAVEEANLNTPGSDPSWLRAPLAFESFRLAGNAAGDAFPVLMRVNGQRDRVGIFIEQVDERFLRRRGFDDQGALYKFVQRRTLTPVFSNATEGVEKKTRLDEGSADLEAFVQGLHAPTAAGRRAWFYDNVDVPGLLNYLAVRCVILDADDVRKNFYLYRDTRGTGEWTIFPWDKDWTFGITGDGGPWLRHPFFGDFAHRKANADQWNELWEFVFNDAEVRWLYLRRLRSVMDRLLGPPGGTGEMTVLEGAARAYVPALSAEVGAAAQAGLNSVLQFLEQRRVDLYVTYAATNRLAGADALVPQGQPDKAQPLIGAVDFNPVSGRQAEEFIRLDNPHSTAFDLSGWQIDGGIRHTFRPGTVIAAGGSLFLSPEVRAFRNRAEAPTGGEARLIQGDYAGQLSARGETLVLLDPTGRERLRWDYPAEPTPAQQWLRVTELMFHPADTAPASGDGNLEFIELKNIGPGPLDLRGVRFTDGIAFAFDGAAPAVLGPGEAGVLVADETAFRAAYGPSVRVLGVFTGRLDNGGERVRLVDGVGEEILDFRYEDAWYPLADGAGRSLVIKDPAAPWSTWGDPLSWDISVAAGGSPGQDEDPWTGEDRDGDGMLDDWERRHDLDPAINDAALDPDADGLRNLGEFHAGTDPRDPASCLRLNVAVDDTGRIHLAFTAQPGRTYRVSRAVRLDEEEWQLAREISGVLGEQSFTEPPADATIRFFRLEVTAP